MAEKLRAHQRIAGAAAALGLCAGAFAQSPYPGTGSSTQPRKGDTFIGIAIGKPHYETSCGNISGLSCSNNGTSVSITAGNMFSEYWGAELSYLDLGKADRAGGSVDARGLNLSLVGRVPLGDNFDIAGKVGATYGITHVNANPLAGLMNGRDSGWGLGYGVAVNVHFARGLSASVGWEQHDFQFAGQGTSAVKNVTLGLAYRF
jgi:OOP family OmpA-OmpF porin